MEEDTKQVIATVLGVIVIAAMITSCTYRQNVSLPQQMAEKGYCWQVLAPVGGAPYGTYVPCKPEK